MRHQLPFEWILNESMRGVDKRPVRGVVSLHRSRSSSTMRSSRAGNVESVLGKEGVTGGLDLGLAISRSAAVSAVAP